MDYLICRPEVDMDAKLTENVIFVRDREDFVLQFIKLTFIPTLSVNSRIVQGK